MHVLCDSYHRMAIRFGLPALLIILSQPVLKQQSLKIDYICICVSACLVKRGIRQRNSQSLVVFVFQDQWLYTSFYYVHIYLYIYTYHVCMHSISTHVRTHLHMCCICVHNMSTYILFHICKLTMLLYSQSISLSLWSGYYNAKRHDRSGLNR